MRTQKAGRPGHNRRGLAGNFVVAGCFYRTSRTRRKWERGRVIERRWEKNFNSYLFRAGSEHNHRNSAKQNLEIQPQRPIVDVTRDPIEPQSLKSFTSLRPPDLPQTRQSRLDAQASPVSQIVELAGSHPRAGAVGRPDSSRPAARSTTAAARRCWNLRRNRPKRVTRGSSDTLKTGPSISLNAASSWRRCSGVGHHGPKLQHDKRLPIEAAAFLPEQDRGPLKSTR